MNVECHRTKKTHNKDGETTLKRKQLSLHMYILCTSTTVQLSMYILCASTRVQLHVHVYTCKPVHCVYIYPVQRFA